MKNLWNFTTECMDALVWNLTSTLARVLNSSEYEHYSLIPRLLPSFQYYMLPKKLGRSLKMKL